MDNRILNLILDKLENIEKEQQEMKKDLCDVKKDLCDVKKDLHDVKADQSSLRSELMEMKKDLHDVKADQGSLRSELMEMKKEVCQRLDRLEQGQEAIKEFMFNAEKAFKRCDEDHKFIENLKKAIGE